MTDPSLVSFAHEGTLVSLLVPEGWEATEVAVNHVRFFGPEQPDHDGYQPTFSILSGEPEGFGEDWFEQFREQSMATLRESCTGLALRSNERFTLSSLVEVAATWYDWTPQPGMHVSQLHALIPVDALRMYVVNAATLQPLADRDLPIFDHVLRSLRVLPRR